MRKSDLNKMTGGWFIGNFSPSLFRTNDVEVAVKKYKKGDKEDEHFHKIATEYTVIVKGKARMGEKIYQADDIITIQPNESTDFEALEDTITVAVKIPGASNDKYLTKK